MNQAALLAIILEEEGQKLEDFMANCIFDSVVPGICVDPDCLCVADRCEPDMRKGYCESCGENTVISGLELCY